MAFKFIAMFALVAAANAGIIPVQQQYHELPLEHYQHQQPATIYQSAPPQHHVLLQKPHPEHEQYPDDPHPKYNFSYDVQDAISGDSKSQSESRDGDVVQGEYSLDDADGFRRTVKYTADSVNGFNAVVHREPLVGHHHVLTAAAPAQYHHTPSAHAYTAPAAIVKAPVAYATPTYNSIPAQHQEQHPHQYATYETPQHEEHQQYYHH